MTSSGRERGDIPEDDFAEQQTELPGTDYDRDEVPEGDPDLEPWDADPADVSDQRREVPLDDEEP